MPTPPTQLDRSQWPARNVRAILTVAAIDLFICILLPIAFASMQGSAFWVLLACLMALHVPILIMCGFSWRTHAPEKLRFAAIVVAAACLCVNVASFFLVLIFRELMVAIWLIFCLAGPPILFAMLCEESKPPKGTCHACGYSLEGLTTTTCPECGKLQPTQHPTA